MIEITICKRSDEKKSICSIQVSGHADSVTEGADLVCCAVSVLTINLVNSLDHLTDDVFVFDQHETIGFMSVVFRDEPSEKAALLLSSYELGILSTAARYSDWLKVYTEEV